MFDKGRKIMEKHLDKFISEGNLHEWRSVLLILLSSQATLNSDI